MTEQQANALMLWISDLTKVYGNEGPELKALTALCRHRDQVVYGALFSKAWELDIVDLQNRIDDMQTWEDL